MRYKAILLFGPPGVGKGTIGRLIATGETVFHLSSGEIFRGIEPDSESGRLVNKYTSQGFLVPDDATIEIWSKYMEGLVATNRFFPKKQILLLDGIPRTKHQAELLDHYIDVKRIFLFDVEDPEILIQRLKKRAEIEKRSDDREESILRTRFNIYRKETIRVLEHYPSSLIATFNADQQPLEVLRDVLTTEGDFLNSK